MKSGIKAELCDTCPARGLCVSDVELGVTPLINYQTDGEVDAAAITAVDKDGVESRVALFMPESYDGRATEAYGSIRSNEVIASLADDPNKLLRAISERANLCNAPHLENEYVGTAIQGEVHLDRIMRVKSICRAVGGNVVATLATPPQPTE